MDRAQLATYNYLKSRILGRGDRIMFDPKVNEIVVAADDNVLIVISSNTVFINNHIGFVPTVYTDIQYKVVLDLLETEAHRYRRKLKSQIIKNKESFIESLTEKP